MNVDGLDAKSNVQYLDGYGKQRLLDNSRVGRWDTAHEFFLVPPVENPGRCIVRAHHHIFSVWKIKIAIFNGNAQCHIALSIQTEDYEIAESVLILGGPFCVVGN